MIMKDMVKKYVIMKCVTLFYNNSLHRNYTMYKYYVLLLLLHVINPVTDIKTDLLS